MLPLNCGSCVRFGSLVLGQSSVQPDPSSPAQGAGATGTAVGAPTVAPSSVLSLLEHSSEGFIAFDRAWRYVYVNVRAEQLLRKSRAELIGRTVWEMFPDADGAVFANEFRRAVAEKVSREFRVHWPPLDAWFDVRACPSDEGLTVYFHDVTRQLATERALEESRGRIGLITDSVPALISYVDRELRYGFVNRAYAEWFGVAPEEVIGRTPSKR